MSNFFKELLKKDFFEEKTASEHDVVKSTLDTITPEVLEKLAEEIGAMTVESSMVSLEEKLASDDEDKKEDDKKEGEPTKCEASEGDKAGDKKEDEDEPTKAEASDDAKEDKEEEKKEDEPTKTEASDDTKEEKEEEEPTKAEASDDAKEDKEEEKKEDEPTTSEASGDDEKRTPLGESDTEKKANEYDYETLKDAYTLAGEKLAQVGCTTADYVFSKTANEDISNFVADKAEKLAFLSERPALMVADEILGSISEKLG